MINSISKAFAILFTVLILSACGPEQAASPAHSSPAYSSPAVSAIEQRQNPLLTVYKDPNCGCCKHWISHVNEHGYSTNTVHPQDIWAVKARYNISGNMQSCHTAVTPDGFVFEGHVPAKFMDQFLANPPHGAIGLTVPAMVVGSPGMEVGDKFNAYEIRLLMQDGSNELYQSITSYQQQF